MKLVDGQAYELVLQHGTYTKANVDALRRQRVQDGLPEGDEQPDDPVTEAITGTVRVFKQDGETRYEVITDEVEAIANVDGTPRTIYRTVGFRPEHVLKATNQ